MKKRNWGIEVKNPEGPFVTFGEVLLQHNCGPWPLEHCLAQDNYPYELYPAGTEFNTGVALYRLGHRVKHVGAYVDDPHGETLLELMKPMGPTLGHYNKVTGNDIRTPYFYVDNGCGLRPGEAKMFRENSPTSTLQPGMLNWDKILKGAKCFIVSTITVSINREVKATVDKAIKAARKAGAVVAVDLSYREQQHINNGGKANFRRIARWLAERADIVFCNYDYGLEDLGLKVKQLKEGLPKKFSGIKVISSAKRTINSNDVQTYQGCTWSITSKARTRQFGTKYTTRVIHRIGSGDAFFGMLLYEIFEQSPILRATNMAAVCGALQMTTPGDALVVPKETILRVYNSQGKGGLDAQR